MSLHRFKVSFSNLSASEKFELTDRIEKHSWNGLHWYPNFDSAEFFIDENVNLSILDLPASCLLTRLY